ncbi:MAG: hypothetical protein UU48_C0006G0019 [Candidatus Uhrbacteria bacterium GW2011_GWF2_41_16]|uniref:Uncharacterized protein n=2 Tax=Candidatus Uhriibacteriota TaxID=1752732 RepID=A0A0G0VAP3_9BACT|nr:MAG: hypothetical protein UU35_C0015G0004 [Candidatus Uhrbacteria bacterium GW2011_GWC2_41_11]KKR97979.1 MAG: hypothetical protein UU48_C0006G0019 [Candidatus Uhrbacteria bacterium GW2011_GWF2_41_16]
MFQMNDFALTLSQVLLRDKRTHESSQASMQEPKWQGAAFIAGTSLLVAICFTGLFLL